jgi:hypothetical protein
MIALIALISTVYVRGERREGEGGTDVECD